jgi:lipopolysaccharide biosynthesis glycosyltransferase
MEEQAGKQKGKVAFCVNCSDEYFYSMNTDKLIKSAKYFHPDIPFFVYGSADMKELNVPLQIMMPFIMYKLIDDYEMVVRFDADSIITGSLDEMLNATDYDLICVRNNNDDNKAGKDEPIAQFNVHAENYVNAGLVATTSKAFLEEWMDINLSVGTMLPFVEQTTLNAIKRKYKTLIVDSKESDVYYGVSCLYGDGSENQTHWDCWKDINVVNGGLYLNSKKIKVLHNGGGFSPDKMQLYRFNERTRKRIVEIIEGQNLERSVATDAQP